MRVKIFAGSSSNVENDANKWLADNPNVTVKKLSTTKDEGVLSLTFLYLGEEAGEKPTSVLSQEFLQTPTGRPWQTANP